jgi:hypothetical protein
VSDARETISPAHNARHHRASERESLVDEPLQPVDGEGTVAEDLDEWASPQVLDHQPEHEVVGLRVGERTARRPPLGRHQLQDLRRRPEPLRFGLLAGVQQFVVVRKTAAVAEQMTDGCPIGVELEIPRKVIGDRVVQGQLAGLDQSASPGLPPPTW